MFPPEMMAATFLFLKRQSLIAAARTIAPDNYTTIFIRSMNILDAYMIYSSETRIISLMYFCSTEKVLSPMLVLTPYARERGG